LRGRRGRRSAAARREDLLRLGTEAQQIFAACGGASPTTTAAQEQSFHGCW